MLTTSNPSYPPGQSYTPESTEKKPAVLPTFAGVDYDDTRAKGCPRCNHSRTVGQVYGGQAGPRGTGQVLLQGGCEPAEEVWVFERYSVAFILIKTVLY